MSKKDGFDYCFFCDDDGNLESLRFSFDTGYKLFRNQFDCMDCGCSSFSYDSHVFSGFIDGLVSFVPENFYDYDRFVTYFNHSTEIPIKRVFFFDCRKRADDPREINMAESFFVIEDEDFCVRVTPYSKRCKALFDLAVNHKDYLHVLSSLISLFEKEGDGE